MKQGKYNCGSDRIVQKKWKLSIGATISAVFDDPWCRRCPSCSGSLFNQRLIYTQCHPCWYWSVGSLEACTQAHLLRFHTLLCGLCVGKWTCKWTWVQNHITGVRLHASTSHCAWTQLKIVSFIHSLYTCAHLCINNAYDHSNSISGMTLIPFNIKINLFIIL